MRVYREGDKWYLDVHNGPGKRVRLAGFASESATRKFGHKLQEAIDHVRAGAILPPHLSEFVALLTPRQSVKLQAIGLSFTGPAPSTASIVDHVDAWEAALRRRERVPAHIAAHVGRVRLAVGRMGWSTLVDLTADAVERLVADLRKDTEDHWRRSASTANHYVVALKHFAKWCVGATLLPVDPLAKVRKIAVLEKVKVRRALPPDDVAKLLEYTKDQPRGWLYRLAVETGFRFGELMSLTPDSFTLGKQPAVTVRASYSRKAKRDRTVPLLQSTAKELQKWLANCNREQHLFAGLIPRPELAAPILRGDLAAAGVDVVDDLDFHCLRHTFCTRLGRTGIDLQTFMSLTGHRTAAVALGYIHDDEGERRKAIAVAQALSVGSQKAGKRQKKP